MLNLSGSVEPVWHYRAAGLWSTVKSTNLSVLFRVLHPSERNKSVRSNEAVGEPGICLKKKTKKTQKPNQRNRYGLCAGSRRRAVSFWSPRCPRGSRGAAPRRAEDARGAARERGGVRHCESRVGGGEESQTQMRWSQRSRGALNGQSGWRASGKASPTTIGELFSAWMAWTLAVFSWVAVLRAGAWFSFAADAGILFAVKF